MIEHIVFAMTSQFWLYYIYTSERFKKIKRDCLQAEYLMSQTVGSLACMQLLFSLGLYLKEYMVRCKFVTNNF